MTIMSPSIVSPGEHRVFERFSLFTTRLPDGLDREVRVRFEELWESHPAILEVHCSRG